MPFHFSILFLDIPDASLEGTILLLDVIDDTFVIIIFVPDKVLSRHVAIEVDAGLKNIVIGIDLLPQLLLVFNTSV